MLPILSFIFQKGCRIMGKRKKQKKKKPHDSPVLTLEEENLLSSFLEDRKNIDLSIIKDQIQSPQLAQALVEKLPVDDPETLNQVLAIRETFSQKNVQRAVKKTIFRLKQKGISVPGPDSLKKTPILSKNPESAEPSAYLGAIDGLGNRAVFIALPQIPMGVDVGMGVINDEEGIIHFVFGSNSKKRMREVKNMFFESIGHMVETSLPHAATILERAYTLNEGGIGESSSGYLQLRPWILENVSLLERSVIYDFIPLESVSREILTPFQIDQLLGHELMKSWIIDPNNLKPLMDEIQKAEESPIFISEEQKANRINEVKENGIAKLYPDSKRLLLKNRLEEVAHVFFKSEEEANARLCLTAALSLDEKDSFLGVNPFLKTMVERSLDFCSEAIKGTGESTDPEDVSSSGIILP